ncbi:hypothetical protein ACWF2L_21550 [Streptomyces anulatus]
MLNKIAMEPGECALCGAKALCWPRGTQPSEQQERLGMDWRHAGRPAEEGREVCSIVLSGGYYMTRRDLEAAFKATPGAEVEQFEVRNFAPRAHHIASSNPSGYGGSSLFGDRETAERNANKSADGSDSAYVYRVVNGVTEPKACYVGKWEGSA